MTVPYHDNFSWNWFHVKKVFVQLIKRAAVDAGVGYMFQTSRTKMLKKRKLPMLLLVVSYSLYSHITHCMQGFYISRKSILALYIK